MSNFSYVEIEIHFVMKHINYDIFRYNLFS